MFERFTLDARRVVEAATAHAQQATATETRPEHLLQAVLDDESGAAARVLTATGASVEQLRAALTTERQRYVDGLDADDAEALRLIGIDLDEVVRRIDRNLGGALTGRRPRFARSSKKALELALRETLALRHSAIGAEHLLLGLVRGGDRVVLDTLRACGLDPAGLHAAVAEDAERRQAG
jgi:ATP-dependent Clp protease ATP-binding subunit ClpA